MALQAADGDRPVEARPDAGLLAQALDRAGGAAGPPERIGGEDRAGAALEVARRDLADERRDVDPGGTGVRARGVEAVEAPLGLGPRGGLSQRRQRKERIGQAPDRTRRDSWSLTLARSPAGGDGTGRGFMVRARVPVSEGRWA